MSQRIKAPRVSIRDFKREKSVFLVIWQIDLLEEEDKGLRRPPTPLEAFKHHLAFQPRIFMEQVFKLCAFYPIFFIIFSMDCLKDFLHISLLISLLFFFSILPLISMPKNMKNSHNVKGGFKKLEWKIACFF